MSTLKTVYMHDIEELCCNDLLLERLDEDAYAISFFIHKKMILAGHDKCAITSDSREFFFSTPIPNEVYDLCSGSYADVLLYLEEQGYTIVWLDHNSDILR